MIFPWERVIYVDIWVYLSKGDGLSERVSSQFVLMFSLLLLFFIQNPAYGQRGEINPLSIEQSYLQLVVSGSLICDNKPCSLRVNPLPINSYQNATFRLYCNNRYIMGDSCSVNNSDIEFDIIYDIERKRKGINITELPEYNISFGIGSQYLEQSKYAVIDDNIIDLAEKITKKEKDIFSIVLALVYWINTNIRYDTSCANFTEKSDWVLKNRRGVCDEISNLLISFLRSLDIPARYVSGYVYGSVDGGNFRWLRHAWVEFHTKDYGWIPVDPLYGEIGWIDATHIISFYSKDSGDGKYIGFFNVSSGTLNRLTIKPEFKRYYSLKQKIKTEILLPSFVAKNSSFVLELTVFNPNEFYEILPIYLLYPCRVCEQRFSFGSPRITMIVPPKKNKTIFWILNAAGFGGNYSISIKSLFEIKRGFEVVEDDIYCVYNREIHKKKCVRDPFIFNIYDSLNQSDFIVNPGEKINITIQTYYYNLREYMNGLFFVNTGEEFYSSGYVGGYGRITVKSPKATSIINIKVKDSLTGIAYNKDFELNVKGMRINYINDLFVMGVATPIEIEAYYDTGEKVENFNIYLVIDERDFRYRCSNPCEIVFNFTGDETAKILVFDDEGIYSGITKQIRVTVPDIMVESLGIDNNAGINTEGNKIGFTLLAFIRNTLPHLVNEINYSVEAGNITVYHSQIVFDDRKMVRMRIPLGLTRNETEISLIVDPENSIPEVNEENNIKTLKLDDLMVSTKSGSRNISEEIYIGSDKDTIDSITPVISQVVAQNKKSFNGEIELTATPRVEKRYNTEIKNARGDNIYYFQIFLFSVLILVIFYYLSRRSSIQEKKTTLTDYYGGRTGEYTGYYNYYRSGENRIYSREQYDYRGYYR